MFDQTAQTEFSSSLLWAIVPVSSKSIDYLLLPAGSEAGLLFKIMMCSSLVVWLQSAFLQPIPKMLFLNTPLRDGRINRRFNPGDVGRTAEMGADACLNADTVIGREVGGTLNLFMTFVQMCQFGDLCRDRWGDSCGEVTELQAPVLLLALSPAVSLWIARGGGRSMRGSAGEAWFWDKAAKNNKKTFHKMMEHFFKNVAEVFVNEA